MAFEQLGPELPAVAMGRAHPGASPVDVVSAWGLGHPLNPHCGLVPCEAAAAVAGFMGGDPEAVRMAVHAASSPEVAQLAHCRAG